MPPEQCPVLCQETRCLLMSMFEAQSQLAWPQPEDIPGRKPRETDCLSPHLGQALGSGMATLLPATYGQVLARLLYSA